MHPGYLKTYRFYGTPLYWRPIGKYHELENFVQWMRQIRIFLHVNQSFRREQLISKIKSTMRTRIFLGFFIPDLGVSNQNVRQRIVWNPPLITHCGIHFFNTNSGRTLSSFGHFDVQMHTNIFYILTGMNILTGYKARRRTGECPEYDNMPFVMVIRWPRTRKYVTHEGKNQTNELK